MDSGVSNVGTFIFDGCNLATSRSQYIMDLTNLSFSNKGLIIRGCKLSRTGGSTTINIAEASSMVWIEKTIDEGYFRFVGDGAGIIEGVMRRKITYDGGTQVIGTLPKRAVVYGVKTFPSVSFDGDTTINIGDDDDNDGFLPDSSIYKTGYFHSGYEHDKLGAYLWDSSKNCTKEKVYTTQTTIKAYVTTTTGTKGEMYVWILFYLLEVKD